MKVCGIGGAHSYLRRMPTAVAEGLEKALPTAQRLFAITCVKRTAANLGLLDDFREALSVIDRATAEEVQRQAALIDDLDAAAFDVQDLCTTCGQTEVRDF